MKKENKDFKKQLQRVKDLILQYQYRMRNGATRNKMFLYAALIKKCEDAASRKDEDAIGIYYKELQLCD